MHKGQELLEGAMGGALVGLVASERTYRDRRDQETRQALSTGQNALALARSAASGVDSLVDSGDIIRIGVDTVSDFMTGLCFGGNLESPPPSALPTPPTGFVRLLLDEALAVAPQQWPPATNDYDLKGQLLKRGDWLLGQNAATGLALSYAENRAFLLGLPQKSHPSSVVLAQYYRAARGLADALATAGALGTPLTEAQYAAAWSKMFGLSTSASVPGYSAGVIYRALADAVAVSNSTTEMELAEVPWPAGLLAVGEVAEVTFGEVVSSSAANLIARVHVDNLSGAIVSQQTITPGGTQTKRQSILITRRADVGGNEQYEIQDSFSDVAVTDVVSFPSGADHKLVLTGTWSAASTSNVATAKTAMLRKF